jgi:hypothetical protein
MANSRSRAITTLLLATSLFALARSASTQIIEDREYHGQTIMCALSGLRGFDSTCGLDKFYEDIFLRSVVTVAEVADNEFQLTLMPEEVFLGSSVAVLDVKTNQGDCLPEIVPGSRWLFFLRRDEKDHALYLEYGSGSGPEKDEQEQITLLRRLMKMDHSGYVHGYVSGSDFKPAQNPDSMDEEDHVDLPNHRVIATPKGHGKLFTASTDKDGNFEFESLPSGSYHFSANTAAGLWAEEGTVEVSPHSCMWIGFEMEPNGTIAGHITTPDGKSAHYVEVYALTASENGRPFKSAFTDEQGHYEVKGLRPGRYIVGVESDLLAASFSETPMILKLYYPGVPTRQRAIEIDLDKAGSRADIDFQVSPSAVPPTDDMSH